MSHHLTIPTLLLKTSDKTGVFADVEEYLNQLKLGIATQDSSRPWGGFFVLQENQAELFGKIFFPDVKLSDLYISGKLSPKLLLVEPGRRLSWQYHHRRAEIWRVIYGKAGVVTSDTDIEGEIAVLDEGDTIRLSQGQRHRLIGLEGWGIVAEIWQHTNAAVPSDETDIIRLQDDFGR